MFESADRAQAWESLRRQLGEAPRRVLVAESAAGGSAAGPDVRGWIEQLGRLDRDIDDAARVERLRVLEELKAAAAAAQAVCAADFDASQRRAAMALGEPAERAGRGVGAQVGLARRESAHRGNRQLGLAKALVSELPCTLAAMADGWVSEWRATLIARETACLDPDTRREVDAELAGCAERLSRLGDRQLVAQARTLVARADPSALVRRRAQAEADRTVTCRPAPDAMAYLTVLAPAAQAVAGYAALVRAADTARADGDPRSRGQVMADTLIERATGQTSAAAVPVQVQLLVDDTALLTSGDEPAVLSGYGPVHAQVARDLATNPEAKVWLRRIYRAPGSGDLTGADAGCRLFPRALQQLIRARDQTCAMPWCDAPIRHADHITGHGYGGPTSLANAQGLCEGCNHAKQAPGWSARPRPAPGGRHTVDTTTPTGHTYRATAPPPPGTPWPSAVEYFFADRALTG